MVLLEFEMCPSRCSYFPCCSIEREAILNSLISPNSPSEHVKEIKVMDFTKKQITGNLQLIKAAEIRTNLLRTASFIAKNVIQMCTNVFTCSGFLMGC
jgi:hypothetical protein